MDFDKPIPGFNKKAFEAWVKENPESAHIEDRRQEGTYFMLQSMGAPDEVLKQYEHKLYGFEGTPENERPSTIPVQPQDKVDEINKLLRRTEEVDQLRKNYKERSERNKK